MKFHIVSHDAVGKIDQPITNILLSHLPQAKTMRDCDAVIIPITFFADYDFNQKLDDINKPYVIFDFMEYSLAFDYKDTHIFGKNPDVARNLQSDPWWKLNNWIKDRPPILYFKRELLKKDASDKIKPIEFPCYLPARPIESRQKFNSRPIEVFHCWGYSHESRPRLHGDIFKAMATHGLGVVSDWRHMDGYLQYPEKRTWMSVFSPHYARQPMSVLQSYMDKSKITVSLPGAGRKCFRHGECVNTIMATWDDGLAWSFPWIDEQNGNCISLGGDGANLEFSCLRAACDWDQFPWSGLYDIYVRGQENMDKYRSDRYVNEYIIPEIERVL